METRVPIFGHASSDAFLIDDAPWSTAGKTGVSFRFEHEKGSFVVDAEALRHALRAYDAKNP